LAANGFRRSGDLVYRPHCADCRACIPVRIPVREFQPNRSQRRIGKLNAGLRVIAKSAEYDDEHYRLYARYLDARHPDSGMGQSDPEDYIRFLGNSGWLDSVFFEFREGETLLAVSVVDRLKEGLSAVYTFYDPVMERRSLGTYAILWQIGESQRQALSWLYLGFWIAECRKMAYKGSFQPLQALTESGWVTIDNRKSMTPDVIK
jgi:arginine-tRNA-protein transferase